MKVAELIEILKTKDPKTEIHIIFGECNNSTYYIPLSKVYDDVYSDSFKYRSSIRNKKPEIKYPTIIFEFSS